MGVKRHAPTVLPL